MEPSTKRKHVTTACVLCRESKIKCNGATPACSSCLNKGKECRYEAREDRRKLSLRIAVELLNNRVQQLSQCILDHGYELPSMPAADDKTLAGIFDALQLPRAPFPTVIDNQHERSATLDAAASVATPVSNDGSDTNALTTASDAPVMPVPAVPEPSSDSADWEWSMPPVTLQQEPVTQPPSYGEGNIPMPVHAPIPTSAHPVQLQHQNSNELVDQLSDRVGTLHIRPGGHIRFYGSTSNFNLLESTASDVAMNVHRTIRNDGPELLDRLGLNKKVPPAIEDHLVELYFTWQDPSFHVVDRTIYEEAKVAWRERMEDTSYYSEALRNAICALGAAFDARHHPAFVTFPRSLADFFADRAKALLEIELDSPCVATIQTLVLLSSHDIGCGRDARGWLFSGMAMRLSLNLGLHHDLKPYISKGVVAATEPAIRRTVFWAACIVDHFYLGQPLRMNMEGISLEKPSGKTHTDGAIAPCPTNSIDNVTSMPLHMTEHIDDVCRYQVLLFELMAPLSDALCGNDTMSKSTLLDTNYQIFAKLNQWKESLPLALRVDLTNRDTTYLPHVILLHMQYYQSVIYAYRPWMSKTSNMPPPHMAAHQGPGSAEYARKMCMDAASAISQLLRLYEERYTLRRINIQAVAITFSAALLLVFATVSHSQTESASDKDMILADLSACFRALDELAPAWDTAKRARDFLIRLQRHWECQARSSSSSYSWASKSTPRDETVSINGSGDGSIYSDFSSTSASRKRPRMSMASANSGDSSPTVRFRAETSTSSHTGGGEYWPSNSNNNMATDFDVDLDFDLMLSTSMEGMPGNWGNVFSVQSTNTMLNSV